MLASGSVHNPQLQDVSNMVFPQPIGGLPGARDHLVELCYMQESRKRCLNR